MENMDDLKKLEYRYCPYCGQELDNPDKQQIIVQMVLAEDEASVSITVKSDPT